MTRLFSWSVVLIVAVAATASAQTFRGGISGRVIDSTGAVLPGVMITVTNTANGRAQTLVTSDDGRYRAVALQPGPYEVRAELQGFGTIRRQVVRRPIG